MEYQEVRPLKQSDKSTVLLVRETDGERLFVRKVLKGRHHVYSELLNNPHPYLPQLFEANISDDATTVVEEYVEGPLLGGAELSEKQLRNAIKELCSVLEFLHGKGIIHRDIKPSNIILARDGHIRLIDFDAARMIKDEAEQDTRLLGTRGYAPPEQYGFAQTDARADIYALGMTMKQLLGEKAEKARYKRIIQRCTDINPDKRYQSARQVKRAFTNIKRSVLYSSIAVLLIALWGSYAAWWPLVHANPQSMNASSTALPTQSASIVPSAFTTLPISASPTASPTQSVSVAPAALPMPGNPHWDAQTGVALWNNVFESGSRDDEVAYMYKLCRKETADPPTPDDTSWKPSSIIMGRGLVGYSQFELNLASELWENGFYYFAVAAIGDGIAYTDSPFIVSDVFEFTGDSAPFMPQPTDLSWTIPENQGNQGPLVYATWGNFDDYLDADSFIVTFYNQFGERIESNFTTKSKLKTLGRDGVATTPEVLIASGGSKYRFTVRALTSRPNEYRSSPMPNPIPEEYYSPWLEFDD